jgi:hypothetical protein
MHGVEAAAIHAFEQDQVPTGVDDGTGNGKPGLARQLNGRRHYAFGALMREALAIGDVHLKKSRR